jgi:GNAT superfamily N-acetyltransferase
MIRSARPDDVPTLHALIRDLAAYERLEQQVSATEERLRTHLFGSRPFAESIVAEDSGTIAGFAIFFHNYSTFLASPGLYVEDLFVRPDLRRRGHGRRLLGAMATIAADRGCGRLEWSVLDWNAPALAFYRSLGATVMDEWRICRMTAETIGRLAASVRVDPP